MDASTRTVSVLFIGFFIIAAISTLSSSCFAYASNGNLDVTCMESEKQALLSFKRGLEDPSNRLSSWDVENLDCCKWEGVVCSNSTTGHVLELHLQNPNYYRTEVEYAKSQLGGEVSPFLLNLKHLSYLDLSGNDFGGIPIPSFIGSLARLQYLNLSKAGFSGAVPHQLGNLSSLRFLSLKGGPHSNFDVANLDWLSRLSTLEHLDLSQVNLKKSPNWLQVMNLLPSLVELHLSHCGLDHSPSLPHVNFTSLAILDLSHNQFNSLIPQWIFSLSSLVSLNLGSNDFEGPIPNDFWNLTSLKFFNASSNHYLNSSLPDSLFSLNGLVSLNLGSNDFKGPIPSGLQNMTGLRDLDLSWNHFNDLQGKITSSIENLTSVVFLDLSYNDLEHSIPRAVRKLCNLRQLILSGNEFGGDVSELFGNFSECNSYALEVLKLDENQLSGHLPDQLGRFRSMQVLSFLGNSISGPIPSSIGRCSSLKELILGGNQLTGTLPESLGLLSNLEKLRLHNNFLEGVVSEVHFANLTRLVHLSASINRLVLKVSPNWIPPFQLKRLELRLWQLGPQFPMWLHSQKEIVLLDLSCTGISDSIPNWFWNLSSHLQYLNLSHNHIQGGIPNILKLDPTVSFMYLGSNCFSGPLPILSSNITELDLSNNAFSGDIFHFLCDRKDEPNKLEILQLGKNLLSGEIPNCWMNWPALKFIELGNNHLSGNIPSSMGYLQGLQSLHLRNNHLSGEVPSSLTNCTELVTIDLGWNQFVGGLSTWLGRSLSKLMVLSLRSNNFCGKIPSELCNLTSLQMLDLANNSFSGSIPRCFKNFIAMVVKQNSSNLIYYSFVWSEFLENAFVVTKGREFQYNTILTLVTSMDLSNNNLSGEIPEELTSLLGLRSLNLSGNHLEGAIPKEIGNMKLLESLDVSRNQLSGEIPPSMSTMTFLSDLNVSYNDLSGRIPSSTQLQLLDASSFIGNKLCGLPLTKNCSLDGATPDVGKGDHEEGAKSEVDWFYLAMAFGFPVGFWVTCGLIMLKKTWRYSYFQFLGETWNKICICLVKY